MQRLRRGLALALAVVAVVANVRPSVAVAPGIHGFAITATVDAYPCLVPFCSGTVSGTGTAVVAGLSTSSQPFVATWPNPRQPTPLSNTTGTLYDIEDNCLLGGPTPSPNGGGSGLFTLSGGLLVYQGTEQNGAVLTGNFDWLREGPSTLVLTVSNATVVAPNGTTISLQAALAPGVGEGAWTVTTVGVPTCGSPLSHPSVRISADYVAPE